MEAINIIPLDIEVQKNNDTVAAWLLHPQEQTARVPEHEAKSWLALVKEVEQRLPLELQVILHLRRKFSRAAPKRRRGRPSWVKETQRCYAEEMAAHQGLTEEEAWRSSPATFHDKWRQLVGYAAMLAAKRGLLGGGYDGPDSA